MKKIILVLSILFSSFFYAQDVKPVPEKLLLEGMWESNDTSYTCIITVSEFIDINKVETIHNVSFEKDLVLLEKILFQDDTKVITTHTNKVNGHKVESTYVLVDANTLSRQFKGDSDMLIFYTRADTKLKYNLN
tara:strand:+ start:52 stop:453 length:402 start_codon:yes stop_codon:yes gene_type:complete